MIFNKLTELCSHHHNLILGYFYHPSYPFAPILLWSKFCTVLCLIRKYFSMCLNCWGLDLLAIAAPTQAAPLLLVPKSRLPHPVLPPHKPEGVRGEVTTPKRLHSACRPFLYWGTLRIKVNPKFRSEYIIEDLLCARFWGYSRELITVSACVPMGIHLTC